MVCSGIVVVITTLLLAKVLVIDFCVAVVITRVYVVSPVLSGMVVSRAVVKVEKALLTMDVVYWKVDPGLVNVEVNSDLMIESTLSLPMGSGDDGLEDDEVTVTGALRWFEPS